LGLRADTALAFWLGGLRDASGNFVGFSADPTDPFNLNTNHPYNPTSPEARIGPYFDFDKTRVSQTYYNGPATEMLDLGAAVSSPIGGNGLLTTASGYSYYIGATAYFPQNDQVLTMPTTATTRPAMTYSPYLYFKAVASKYSDTTGALNATSNAGETYHFWVQPGDTANSNVCITPFKDARAATALNTLPNPPQNTPRAWVNPQSFQLLCPGLDGYFAQAINGNFYNLARQASDSDGNPAYDAKQRFAPIYPDGLNYNTTPARTQDDVTNFGSGALSGDMR
jgi:hypothetical protein